MMKEENKRLLSKIFSNEPSEQDLKELSEWINISENREDFTSFLYNLWKQSENYPPDMSINSNKIYKNIQDKIKLLEDKDRKGEKEPVKISFSKYRQSFQKIIKIAAVFLFAVLLYSAGYYLLYKPKHIKISYVQITVPNGQKRTVTLPDGTKIWINSGSTLSYPKILGKKQREVLLSGEAFFEVTKNKHRPFIVKTKEVSVKVLGTVFNVSAYPGDKTIETTLVRGKVLAYHEGEKKSRADQVVLFPGENAVFSLAMQTFSVKKVDTKLYTSWKDGILIFRNTPLTEVIKKLNRWYNVNFEIHDKKIGNFVYSVSFKNDSLSTVMNVLTQMTPIKFISSGKQIIVSEDKKRLDYFLKTKSIH